MEEKLQDLIGSLMEKQEVSGRQEEWDAFQFAIEGVQKILSEGRKCKDCGSYYELSDRELAFYQRNNLFLPKRCPECREARKAEKKVANRDTAISVR